jgi:uncharacterized protein YjbJ (UPF0337 family)
VVDTGSLTLTIRKRSWYEMSSKTDEIEGHAKEAVGTLTGDKDLKSEGKADRIAGEAKEKLEDATDKVEEVIDKAKDALHRK